MQYIESALCASFRALEWTTLTPSRLASWSPVSISTITASSPTQAANRRPLASNAVLPPVYMGRRVRDASKVVLTMAFDMVSGIIDVKVAEELSRHPKNEESSAGNRMRQLNNADSEIVLRFNRGTFIFFSGVCTVCHVWTICIMAHKRGSRTRDTIPRLFAASFRLRSDLQPWLETSPIYYPFHRPMPGADEC